MERQDHLDDLHRRLVGDPQAASELALDAHLLQHRADLRAPAMHHDRVHPGLFQESDVARKGLAERRVAHRCAAVLHDDRLVLVALHEGQRLGEEACLVEGVGEPRRASVVHRAFLLKVACNSDKTVSFAAGAREAAMGVTP